VIHSGFAGSSKTTSYDFDLAGRIIQKNTSAPQSYNYQYDGTDQLSLVTNAGGGILQDPDFNSVGNDTGHTVGYYNRVLNDGTDLNVVNGKRPERTGRRSLAERMKSMPTTTASG
jgi:YD repeat-containing protein